jgi:hypothetical protein
MEAELKERLIDNINTEKSPQVNKSIDGPPNNTV